MHGYDKRISCRAAYQDARKFRELCCFFIGTSEQAAKELFENLKGSPDALEDGLLFVELRRVFRGLPIDIRMIGCTLEEMMENVRTITKHQFKSRSLSISDT